jgi:hypothetical protein
MQQMPWFKWWGGTCADPKLRMLAEEIKIPVASVIAIWAYLLEKASTAADRGVIPQDLDVRLMAYTLQLQQFDIETVRNGMERAGLVTETGEIAKWGERQAKRENSEPPGSSTKRVQALRERQKAKQNKDLGGDGGDNKGGTGETDETAGNGEKRPKKKSREEGDIKPKPTSSAAAAGEGGKKPFDQFWDAYPKRVAKIAAQKAWVKLKPDAELVAMILAAIEAQKEGWHWRHENGRFIPNPASWLNAGCWLDEVRPYEAPAPKLPAGWWETKAGAEKVGLMQDPPLTPRPGEFLKDFTQRIRAAMGDIDPAPYVPQEPPRKIERAYVPPAPPADVILTEEQREARREEFKAAARILRETGQLASVVAIKGEDKAA